MKKKILILLITTIFLCGCFNNKYDNMIEKFKRNHTYGKGIYDKENNIYRLSIYRPTIMSITAVITKDKEILEIFYMEYKNNQSLSYCVYGDCYDSEDANEIKEITEKNEKDYLKWCEDMEMDEDDLIEFYNLSFDEINEGKNEDINEFWEIIKIE